MIRFAVVGTNWITKQFIDAAHEVGGYKLTAIYSRGLEQAQAFASDYPIKHLSTSLDELAQSPSVDVVYIVNPSSLHFPQTRLFLGHRKHVIYEKPLASNLQEVEAAVALAKENNVVLFKAFKTVSLPNSLLLKETLPKVDKLRKVFINYCQYSPRYQRYLDGEDSNTFNLAFSNGSIMDIGFYCLTSAVALWDEPRAVLATTSLLDSGVDAQSTVVLSYGNSDVTLHHFKVSDSTIPSEIQGGDGMLVIEKTSECQKLALVLRGGKAQNLTQPQHINIMLYETETFAHLMETQDVNHPDLIVNRTTTKLLSEVRCQAGVIFPTGTQPLV